MSNLAAKGLHVNSTAGAIPVRKKKGDGYMQKVKVQRYVAGKRPDYAPSSSESDSETELPIAKKPIIMRKQDSSEDSKQDARQLTEEELKDPRLRRILQSRQAAALEENEMKLEEDEDEDSDQDESSRRIALHRRLRAQQQEQSSSEDDQNEEDEEDVLTEEQLLAKRKAIKAFNLQKERERELQISQVPEGLDRPEFPDDVHLSPSEDDYTSSDEDDDDEDLAPRLKPVFVRKKDRVTLKTQDTVEQENLRAEYEKKRQASERRSTTLAMMEAELRRETEEARQIDDALEAIDSDEGVGDPEVERAEYERWKVRELKRIRRDRESREALAQERSEVERIHAMTEEERQAEFRRNPKKFTNLAEKGKYKFMQKYFHRGAFFVSNETDKVYQRNFAEPTLEDKFDKSKLPSVMQVKNFGFAGRTKYTHLVDQDTTENDSAWCMPNTQGMKFHATVGGGFKNVFEKPSTSKSKKSK